MNKFRFLIFVMALMCLASCKKDAAQKDETLPVQQEYVGTDDPNKLAYWFPEKDSVNHGYVSVAEHLWILGREDERVDIFDYDVQMQWQKECEEVLVSCFDSIYPQSSLSSFEKSDSMVNVISRFFEEDAEETTMGMLINFDLTNSFLSYKIASLSKEILKYNENFVKEILKWNGIHPEMNDFCCGIVHLNWFGGSGAGPASLATMNAICSERIADLQHILNYYKNGDVPSSWSVESALYDFRKALEQTSGKATTTEKMKEAGLLNDEERAAAYDGIYQQMMKAKARLSDSIGGWVELRKELMQPNGQASKKSPEAITSDMLGRMAKTVMETTN